MAIQCPRRLDALDEGSGDSRGHGIHVQRKVERLAGRTGGLERAIADRQGKTVEPGDAVGDPQRRIVLKGDRRLIDRHGQLAQAEHRLFRREAGEGGELDRNAVETGIGIERIEVVLARQHHIEIVDRDGAGVDGVRRHRAGRERRAEIVGDVQIDLRAAQGDAGDRQRIGRDLGPRDRRAVGALVKSDHSRHVAGSLKAAKRGQRADVLNVDVDRTERRKGRGEAQIAGDAIVALADQKIGHLALAIGHGAQIGAAFELGPVQKSGDCHRALRRITGEIAPRLDREIGELLAVDRKLVPVERQVDIRIGDGAVRLKRELSRAGEGSIDVGGFRQRAVDVGRDRLAGKARIAANGKARTVDREIRHRDRVVRRAGDRAGK